MKNRIALVVGGTAITAAALAGCSAEFSVGDTSTSASQAAEVQSIPKDQLETATSEALTKQVGKTPDEVRCKGPLERKQGATQDCALKSGTTWLPVTVTATDDTGEFNVKVGESAIEEPAW